MFSRPSLEINLQGDKFKEYAKVKLKSVSINIQKSECATRSDEHLRRGPTAADGKEQQHKSAWIEQALVCGGGGNREKQQMWGFLLGGLEKLYCNGKLVSENAVGGNANGTKWVLRKTHLGV